MSSKIGRLFFGHPMETKLIFLKKSFFEQANYITYRLLDQFMPPYEPMVNLEVVNFLEEVVNPLRMCTMIPWPTITFKMANSQLPCMCFI